MEEILQKQQMHLELIDIKLQDIHLRQLQWPACLKTYNLFCRAPFALADIAIALHNPLHRPSRNSHPLATQLIADLTRTKPWIVSPGVEDTSLLCFADLFLSTTSRCLFPREKVVSSQCLKKITPFVDRGVMNPRKFRCLFDSDLRCASKYYQFLFLTILFPGHLILPSLEERSVTLKQRQFYGIIVADTSMLLMLPENL